MTDGLLLSGELCRRSGATYRQIDYWARLGIIVPEVDASRSGRWRRWHPDTVTLVNRLLHVSFVVGRGVNTDMARRIIKQLRAYPDDDWVPIPTDDPAVALYVAGMRNHTPDDHSRCPYIVTDSEGTSYCALAESGTS